MSFRGGAAAELAKRLLAPLLRLFRNQFPTVSNTGAADGCSATLGSLNEPFQTRLRSMYAGEPQLDLDGNHHSLDRQTMISREQGLWIYDLCLTLKPAATLEIGMAYGYSSLFFLAALAKNGRGHHTAIDPFQRSTWRGIGLVHARSSAPDESSLGHTFRLIEDRSDRVAIDLARSDASFGVIFIDGNHRFDDVIVDFYLYAPLCTIGGYIVFDDLWMASIQTVVDFVRTNRSDFVETPTNQANMVAFRKVADDSRRWNHFQKFSVSRSSD